MLALWRFWQTRGHIIEARQWCERVLGVRGLAPSDRLRALEAAGGIVYWQGDPEAVKRYYQEAYDLARQFGTLAERANAAYNFSFTFFVVTATTVTPDPALARPLMEEAIEVWRALGDRAGVARASWALASLLQQASLAPSGEQLEHALAYAREGLAEHRILGNRFDAAWSLHLVGLITLKLGDADGAEPPWREALEMFREVSDVSGYALLTADFGRLAQVRGQRVRQATLVGATYGLVRSTGMALATSFGPAEGFATPEDIAPELDAALQRGRAMSADEAVAYALGSEET